MVDPFFTTAPESETTFHPPIQRMETAPQIRRT